MSFASEFKEFVLRGNVVDLAVGVVIGAGFGAVVKSFTDDFLTPLIKIPSKSAVDFKDLVFTVGGGVFHYGDFINAIIAFLLTALVVFAFVVKPINIIITSKMKTAPPAPETTRECPECLSKVPIEAKRCMFCTSPLTAA